MTDSTIESAQFMTVRDLVKAEPGFTTGGLRHLIFQRGQELDEAGVLVHFGRRVLFDLPKFREWIRSGGARQIAGRAA